MVESSDGAELGRVVAEVGLGHRPREVERTVPIALGIFRLASLGLLATPTLLVFCETWGSPMNLRPTHGCSR
jgi:hypothetical protein